MKCKRSSFGAVYFEDSKKIYAFGGLEGKENGFHPVLSGMECEAYDITQDTWEEFKIKNLPKLCSFGFCKIENSKVAIFGGSDGVIICSDLIIVDFNGKSAETKFVDNSEEQALCKLFYRDTNNTLYIYGGHNQLGNGSRIKLENKLIWEEEPTDLDVLLVNDSVANLMNMGGVYFSKNPNP